MAQIPTISELRHELGFAEGDKPQYDCHEFKVDLRSFRLEFCTAAGTEGRALHQWKSRDHDLGLREMVDAYLDRDGKGVKFWPDDPGKRYFSSSLQYTKHKSIIQQNLKLLLFRLNLQQHRNAKYKPAKQPKSEAHATRPGEPSNIDEAIRSAIWRTEEDVKPANLASQPFTIIKFSASGAAADKPPTDPYALPSSRESSQRLAQHGFRVVGAFPAPTSSRTTPDAHRAKRAKTHHDGPDGLIVIPEDSSSKPSQVVRLQLPQASSAQPSAGQPRQRSAPPSASQTIPRASEQPPTSNTPAYVAAETSVPVNPPMEDTTTPSTATPKEPPAVHFTYRLVLSREHPEKNKEWTPQGGFRDITLGRLMREMPLGVDTDFSGLQFTLWGPAVRVSHRVLNGQNAEFDAMKQKFEAFIISCLMEAQSGRTIDFELEVQPITPESQAAPAPADHGLAPHW